MEMITQRVVRRFREREIKMKSVKIMLKTIQDVREFVNAVTGVDYEVDLMQNRYVIDAKSLMGIFSLDLLSPIELVARTDDAGALFDKISAFIVK